MDTIASTRLYQGNCLEVLKGFPDNSVDAIVTDPPYGVLNHKIETAIDLNLFYAESFRILKPNSFMVYYGQQPTLTDFNVAAFAAGFQYKTEIIWYKRLASSGLSDICRVYENIMLVTKGKRLINQIKRPYSDVKESLAEFTEIGTIKSMESGVKCFLKDKERMRKYLDYLETGDYSGFILEHEEKKNDNAIWRKGLKKIDKRFNEIKTITEGVKPQNIVSFKAHNKQRFNKPEFNIPHPTVKPIELMTYLIDLTSNEGNIILDPFMGSGTTGIAAKNNGRGFIGIELDKEYFEIAKKRIGEDAENKTESTESTESQDIEPQPQQLKLF